MDMVRNCRHSKTVGRLECLAVWILNQFRRIQGICVEFSVTAAGLEFEMNFDNVGIHRLTWAQSISGTGRIDRSSSFISVSIQRLLSHSFRKSPEFVGVMHRAFAIATFVEPRLHRTHDLVDPDGRNDLNF